MKYTVESMDEVLEQIKQAIIEETDPQQIILFGSRARGDNRPNSDYDVLVVTEKKKADFKMSGDVHRNLGKRPIGKPVDLLFISPQRLAEVRHDIGFIYRTIDKEGKIIYGNT
jgi:predicted nucleotidyltransferase